MTSRLIAQENIIQKINTQTVVLMMETLLSEKIAEYRQNHLPEYRNDVNSNLYMNIISSIFIFIFM